MRLRHSHRASANAISAARVKADRGPHGLSGPRRCLPSRAMPEDVVTMDKIVALCKRRGFIFPSSEIYGGLGSTYDYGHYGVLLKTNVKDAWWQAMLSRDDIVALDSAILQHPRVWEASGHVGGFSDPMVDCRTCKSASAPTTSASCSARRSRPSIPGEGPDCDLTEARDFNLMFETTVGPVKDSGSVAYLRPETAQGIFINFKNVLQFSRKKPPFGIAQVGKSFRNEITPGNFVFRTREFEQMEMEFFVPPAEAGEWYAYWIEERERWYTELGIRPDHLQDPPPRAGRAEPLLVRHERRRVPVPDRLVRARGHRQPRRLRPRPARRVQRRRSSSTSTRAAASATSRTSSSPPPAPTARRSPSSSTPTTRRRSRARRAPCSSSTRASRR